MKEHEGVSLDLLIPGSLVEARVQSVLSSGLVVSFLTFFTGTVDVFHLEDPLPGADWGQSYAPNQRVRARILYADVSTKCFGLTLNKHLVEGVTPYVPPVIGEVYQNARVRRIDAAIGLLLELPSKSSKVVAPTAAYTHISHASDEHVEKLEKSFKVGKTVRAKVIGVRALDGLLTTSMKESVVKQPVLRLSDIKAGQAVKGKVLSVETAGLRVELAEGIDAFCPTGHLSEFESLVPSEKFRAGAALNFRVLVCPPVSHKITLTHKQALVTSELPRITRYEDATVGLVTHGWISRVEEHGCVVSFYNNVKAFARKSELGLDLLTPVHAVYKVGQVMKCRVLRVTAATKKMAVSFNLSGRKSNEALELTAESTGIRPGDIVSGVVKEVADEMIVLDVISEKGSFSGSMEPFQLSDTPGHVDQLKAVLKAGYRFDRLLVLGFVKQKIALSSKYSLLQAAPCLPASIDQLKVEAIIPGYVFGVTAFGVFVRFLSSLTGLAVRSQTSDTGNTDPASMYAVGQSVSSCVLEVDKDAARFFLSLKQSVSFSRDTSLLEGYFIEEDKIAELQTPDHVENMKGIQIGSVVKARVLETREYGVVVSLDDHPEVVGFVTHYQISDSVEAGQKVKARVLDLAKVDGVVDLSLRKQLVGVDGADKHEVGKKRRHHDAAASLEEASEKVTAVVELVKDDYIVVSLPSRNNQIAFASTRDYNFRAVDPHQLYRPGQKVAGTICQKSLQSSGRVLVLLSSLNAPPLALSSKRARKDIKFRTGSIVQGQVSAIEPFVLVISVDSGVQGRVHITEVLDEFEEGCPFEKFPLGQVLRAKVLGKVRVANSAGKNVVLELSVKPSQVFSRKEKSESVKKSVVSDELDAAEEDEDGGEDVENSGEKTSLECSSSLGLPVLDEFKLGQVITAFVQEVSADWAWLIVNRHFRGRLYVLDSSTSPAELETFKERFKVGQAIRCKILGVNLEHRTLDLTLRGLESEEVVVTKVADVLGGRISQVFSGAGGLAVQIGARTYGRVHVTDMVDDWEDEPGKNFSVGQFVRCVVVGVSSSATGSNQVDLSLTADPKVVAESSLALTKGLKTLEAVASLSSELKVQGYVKAISERGCFVTLSRHVDARVMLCNLSDSFVKEPLKDFPPGKLVTGRILQVDPASGLVSMTLKETQQIEGPASFEELEEGDTVVGRVRRVESFGIFITLQPSKVVGLCHVSEVPVRGAGTLEQQYKVGARVVVNIAKIDIKTKRVSLSMKSVDDMEEEDDTLAGSPSHKLEELLLPRQETGVDKEVHVKETRTNAPVADFSGGPKQDLTLSSVPHLVVVFDTNEDEAEEHGPEGQKPDHASASELDVSQAKASKVVSKEPKGRAAEEGAAGGDPAQDGVPQTAEEFENLVALSPSSSFLWIKYMAFMLSMSEVEKARSIAERAIESINYREEVEKRNVWVAYMNLEYEYGSPSEEAVDKVFRRAVTFCDPKKMYFSLVNLHERHKQLGRCEGVLKTMTRKFNMSAKVWMKLFEISLVSGKEDARKAAFDRALLSLPKRKHVKFISQCAILEFRSGSPDRARAIFEGVLRNYPKRVDLWHHYLDQEIRLGEQSLVRGLFERIICLDIPAKKMKFVFKRFLDYEKAHGDQERVEYVKQKAMAYVESVAG